MFENKEILWNQVIHTIQEREMFDSSTFSTYVKDSKLHEINENQAVISVTLTTGKLCFMSHLAVFEDILSEKLNKKINCIVRTSKEIESINQSQESTSFIFKNGNKLRAENTFDNFILGSSNEAAYSSAYKCATEPENNWFNPLFLYGNSGLGKTHLMHSICNYLKENEPEIQFLYIDGNDLIRLIIDSLYHKKGEQLIQAMTQLDYLLIDDIQHLAKTNDSQELFFNIYNKLINNNKKIILTSDVYPSELNNINNRIISRFTSGLSIGIDSPEFETAVNILHKKLSIRKDIANIDESALYFIARKFNEDVRKLEGALNELIFKSILHNVAIVDEEFAQECFKENPISNANDEISANKIKKVVCNYYNITKKQIESKSRTADIANARHIAVYLCRELLDMPFKKIGGEFGNRDHSTIMSSYEKMNLLLKTKESYQKAVMQIKDKLNVH